MPHKRMKVSEKEEELILKLRRDRRIYNEGIDVAINWLKNHPPYPNSCLEEIELLKKES